MSRLYSGASKFTYKIPKFRGLNENTDGDAKLKVGEASKMLNYRVTDSGGLKVRGGFKFKWSLFEGNAIDGIYCGKAHGHDIVCYAIKDTLFEYMFVDGGLIPVDGITATDLHFFFFNDELYAFADGEYLKWDGKLQNSTFEIVEGYVPTVVIGAEPSGSGTLYEQVNKLTTSRRVRYNADGTATDYMMPEVGVVEIISVSVDGVEKTPSTDYTTSQTMGWNTRGKVTFTTAPAAGINNVEIAYKISPAQMRWYSGVFQGDGVYDFGEGANVLSVTQVTALTEPISLAGWQTLTSDTDYTIDGGVITLTNPSAWSNIKVYYTISDYRAEVTGMRYAETYNGAQDTRVFLYGDGSNTALYSGLTEEGKATAEYFPDLNEMEIGDCGTPITAMIRHRNRLLAFKPHEAYSVYYNPVSLADNTLIAGFYVNNINRDVGCSVMGGAVQVENRIRTVDYNAIWEWKSTNTSGNITSDARNAERISDRVCNTVKAFDLSKAVMLYDIYEHEFYLADGSGKCLVQNTEADEWYVYDNMPATALAMHGQAVEFGTPDCVAYTIDATRKMDDTPEFDGAVNVQVKINAEWESGQLDFDKPQILKYTPTVWLSAVPELNSTVTASISTDNGETASAVLNFKETDGVPRTRKARLKARRFNFYKLKLVQNETTAHAAIISAVITANYDIPVKR